MGYFLNSTCIKNENDFDKIERLYHETAYQDYGKLKRKKSGKLYSTVSVKYFPLPQDSCFCIYDEGNVQAAESAKKLSCGTSGDVISLQIFDSDEMEIKAFESGKQTARIHKNHESYSVEGDVSCIAPDREKLDLALKEDYTFMEDFAEKILPKEIVFPEEKIAGQKIVKYHKEISLPIETDALPYFDSFGNCPPSKESKKFSYQVINRGRKSTGVFCVLTGSAIENKNVVVKNAFCSLIGSQERIECKAAEAKEISGRNCLIYRFDDAAFPAGYNKDSLSSLFKSSNMNLYKKAFEYQNKSMLYFHFDCDVIEEKGEIESYTYPDENLDGGVGCVIDLEWRAKVMEKIN